MQLFDAIPPGILKLMQGCDFLDTSIDVLYGVFCNVCVFGK